jgi:two-component system NtrC family sensor kinase
VARVGRAAASSLVVDLYQGALSVSGSTGRIAQVVMNLLMNAGEASADDHPNLITIRTWAHECDVFLEVSDTGIGIPQDRISRIFEPFVTFKDGGTGIGLSLVQEIVSEHGGDVIVKSIAGVSTTFRVRLPAAGPSTIPPPSIDRRRTSLPDGLEVLVIDSDASIRKLLARTLSRQRVRLADDLHAARLSIEEHPPQVILCDLHLPASDGIAFRDEVSARWPELRDRFVFLHGNDALTLDSRTMAPGCPFLSKPFSTAELELAIFSITRSASMPPPTQPSGPA